MLSLSMTYASFDFYKKHSSTCILGKNDVLKDPFVGSIWAASQYGNHTKAGTFTGFSFACWAEDTRPNRRTCPFAWRLAIQV